jgi:hypothetical protein
VKTGLVGVGKLCCSAAIVMITLDGSDQHLWLIGGTIRGFG